MRRRQIKQIVEPDDEYDVDYDNLVVSDILGTSGIHGLPVGYTAYGGNNRNTFSLYDFS
jgi:hypothetical protein